MSGGTSDSLAHSSLLTLGAVTVGSPFTRRAKKCRSRPQPPSSTASVSARRRICVHVRSERLRLRGPGIPSRHTSGVGRARLQRRRASSMSVRCCLMQCPWIARTSKALGDDRTVDKDATSVAWRNTGDIATIQDHPFMQQELGRANERCREQRLVKISEPDVRETLLAPAIRSASGAAVSPRHTERLRQRTWCALDASDRARRCSQSQLSRRNEQRRYVKGRSGRMRWEKTLPRRKTLATTSPG
jgi:hypothetical protein